MSSASRSSASAAPAASLACRSGPGLPVPAGQLGARRRGRALHPGVPLDKLTKENIVATALFGDGAAACVLRSGETGIATVEMSGQHTWPGTLDIMGWDVDSEGLGVIFDRAIPPFAQSEHRAGHVRHPGRAGSLSEDIDRFACHPGGAKVIEALERALSLEQGSLDHERAVLADYGNMSAPTALFVLGRLIEAGLPSRTLLTAMGPASPRAACRFKSAA